MIVGRIALVVFYLAGTFGLRSAGYVAGPLGIPITIWQLLF